MINRRSALLLGLILSLLVAWSSAALSASAGKKASIASSDSVMSSGVPNTVVIDRNESTPASVSISSGTATSPRSRGTLAFARRGAGGTGKVVSSSRRARRIGSPLAAICC